MSLKFTDKNFKQANCFWLSMHAYRILLPSETDDSRFNSRQKHMLTDSVQPYNKPIIDIACSVCTVKYQTSVFCMDLAPSSLAVHTKKPQPDISQYWPHARSVSRYNYYMACIGIYTWNKQEMHDLKCVLVACRYTFDRRK